MYSFRYGTDGGVWLEMQRIDENYATIGLHAYATAATIEPGEVPPGKSRVGARLHRAEALAALQAALHFPLTSANNIDGHILSSQKFDK